MNTNKSKNQKITVILTGGGTGGHIYPVIAVAQKLNNDPFIEKIYYIGCPHNMEKNITANESYIEFLPVKVSGMPRKFDLRIIKWFFELNKAVYDIIQYFKKIKPDVVFGTGGYVSGSVFIAAVICKIPFVIHEPDAHPGVVTKFMASRAKTVSLAFEDAKNYLKSSNILINANPVRENINKTTKTEALTTLNLDPSRKTILVMGGSQGARTINNAIINSVKKLVLEHNFQVIHQTGKKNFDDCIKNISEIWHDFSNYPQYVIKPYFDDISVPLAAADLAISRAGSISISELNMVNLPSILVPFPYAAADHQRFNARAMEKAGASVFLEDSECNSENLTNLILELFNNQEKLQAMRNSTKNLSKPDAADNIIKIFKNLA